MELATNLFTQGLLMDTHPMVLGNNTLTDCLNGTLVTMNGNEVVLQNDMGNRKIDKAFLPSGYEPVGIKEYGGIIYVAAYNPITNKSLIGSFPSPQLTYSDKNGYNIKNINNKDVIFGDTFDESFGEITINFLKYFLKLFPFKNSDGEEIILHSGDKFTIYASNVVYLDNNKNVNLLEEYFTNYDNVNNGKLKSPKNKKYTLSIGVLNSQNEFVDFTNSLLRWEEVKNNNKTLSAIVSFDNNIPDYIKFNSGYFIPLNYSPSKDSLSFADSELNEKRLKLAANTYAYKLTGPLYAKIDLNIINNLTYNIYESKNDTNNKITLSIETIYEYNCPDFIGTYQQSGDDKYELYEEVDTASTHILKSDIYIKKDSEIINPKNNNVYTPYTDNIIISCKYNPDTNIYKLKKLSKIEINTINNGTPVIDNDDVLDLIIVPKSSDDLGIRKFTYYDTVEISKLNSNELDISDFRYYNNLESQMTLIDLGFKSYPEYGSSFLDLKFEIIKVVNSTEEETTEETTEEETVQEEETILKTFDWGDGGYNGVKTFTWNWDDLDEGVNNVSIDDIKSHILKVKVSYKIYKEGDEIPKTIDRYLMTTKLFNDKYNINSENYERDFGNIENLKIELSIIENNDDSFELIEYEIDGDQTSFKSVNSSIESRLKTIKTQYIKKTSKFGLDRNLYPYEINIENLTFTNIPTLNITKSNNSTYSWKGNNISLFTNNGAGISNQDYNINLSNIIELNFSRQLYGNEIYEATGLVLKNININNLFTSFYDKLDENIEGFHSILHPYATINVLSEDDSNTKYGIGFTYLDYGLSIIDFKEISDNVFPYYNNASKDSDKFIICGNATEDPIYISFNNYSSQIFDLINNSDFPKNKFFFVGTNNNFLKLITRRNEGTTYNEKIFSIYGDDSNLIPSNLNESRRLRHYNQTFPRPILFWMRTTTGGWALLPLKEFTSNQELDTTTGGINLDNGWLGKYAMTLKAKTNTLKESATLGKDSPDSVRYKFVGSQQLLDVNDSQISTYLKNRFKEFYYIGEKNAVKQVYGISNNSTINKISQSNEFNIKISILSPDTTIINNNDSLFYIDNDNPNNNGALFKMFNHEIESKNFILFEKNIEFNENSSKFENLSEDLSSLDNSIDYGLLNKTVVNGNIVENIELYDSNGLKFNANYLYIKNNNSIEMLNNFDIYYDNDGCLRIPGVPKTHTTNYDETLDGQIDMIYATHDNDSHNDTNDQVHLKFDTVNYIPNVLLKD